MDSHEDHYVRVCTLDTAPPHIKALCPVDEATRAIRRVFHRPDVWFAVAWKDEWPVKAEAELIARLMAGDEGGRYQAKANGWTILYVQVGN